MICRYCDEVFETKDEDRKFCSQKCAASYNNRLRKSDRGNCLMCQVSLRAKGGKQFCSKSCEMEFRAKARIVLIELDLGIFSERTLKSYLIEKYGEKCMECGWCQVNPHSGKIPIELEHIDGDSNNKLVNLKLLCPNCHSLTPTYKALNKGNGRKNRKR